MIRYCLPIRAPLLSEVIQLIGNHKDRYHYFEIWLDYLDTADESTIEVLTKTVSAERLIFLFRRNRLEPIQLSIEKRNVLMEAIAAAGALLDLDISSQHEELSARRSMERPPSTIVSYHDYDATPNDDSLRSVVEQIRAHRPAFLKIATFCNIPEDAVRLLSLALSLKHTDQRSIILGMGVHGYVTRIFGTLWGNEMVFAPEERAAESAPGQLTRSELEAIFKALRATE